MTPEQLQKIPFHFVSSLSMEDEHMHSYESEDGRLGYCDHTPKDFNPAVVNINYKPYQNPVARMKREQEAKPSATVVDMPKR